MRSNRSNTKRILLSSLLSLSISLVFCQEFINIRKISLIVGDTTVVAGILANVKIEKVNPDVFYYWYSNGQIYSNQGGYSGNLLHGEYIEYDNSGNLILKGLYEKGVKSGKWIYWYTEGSIKEIIEYEEGQFKGLNTKYTQDGKILFAATYRNNKLHGKVTQIIGDTLFQISYKNGAEKKKIPLYVY